MRARVASRRAAEIQKTNTMKKLFTVFTCLISASLWAAPTGGASAGAASSGSPAPTPANSSLPGSPTTTPAPRTPSLPGTPSSANSSTASDLPGSPTTTAGTTGAGTTTDINGNPTTVQPFAPTVPTAMATNAGLVGFTNIPDAGDFAFTNSTGAAIGIGQLAQLLVNVQNSMEQALPALAAFNNAFDLGATGNGVATARTGTDAASRTVARGVPSHAAPFSPAKRNLALGATHAAGLTPTGVTNAFGLRPGFLPPGLTNPAAVVAARDSLRALVVMQNDMERLLPIVSAFTGANAAGAGIAAPPTVGGVGSGLVTNAFGTPGAGRNARGVLIPTPTGR
jgi:hypothetical protein